ncbi:MULTISPECIES: BPSS1780 family membrane protein [Limnobaculum]|uniref:BPSS1780 family membrane protein n=1 Tax=Limnobaculum TaxID=2172100 RepID=UPI001E2927B7|nr:MULTISPECIES: BPSS1780 family membrane protein [Limnobaculum]
MTQQDHNPYTPPESNVEDVAVVLDKAGETFIPGGQAVPAGEGVNWITQAWNFMKPKLGMWVVLGIVLFVILMIVSFIPFLNILTAVIMPIFVGGIIAICEKQRMTGEVDLGLLFSGFQKNLGSLLGVGAIMFGIMILAIIVMFVVGGSAMLAMAVGSQAGGDPSMAMAGASGGMMFLAFLLMMVIYLVGYALTWFAPALIVVHNLPLGQAVSMSLSAVKKNIVSGLLFFLVMGIIMFISALPFGLGLLITMPLFLATYYTTYRSLFIAK